MRAGLRGISWVTRKSISNVIYASIQRALAFRALIPIPCGYPIKYVPRHFTLLLFHLFPSKLTTDSTANPVTLREIFLPRAHFSRKTASNDFDWVSWNLPFFWRLVSSSLRVVARALNHRVDKEQVRRISPVPRGVLLLPGAKIMTLVEQKNFHYWRRTEWKVCCLIPSGGKKKITRRRFAPPIRVIRSTWFIARSSSAPPPPRKGSFGSYGWENAEKRESIYAHSSNRARLQ